MKLALVFMTLNEIEGVSALWDRIPLHGADEVMCVDGGSSDGTREFFRAKGVRVIEQASRGRGEAFRLAFANSGADALIFFSPDGNEDPNDILRFRPFLEEGCDVVIASRMMPGAHNEEDDSFFRPRKWANNVFNWAANTLWNRGTYVTDTINGFRAVRRDCFQRLNPDSVGYSIEYQMSMRAMKLGARIVEFPTREGSRIGGESLAKSIPTGLEFLKLLLREIRIGRGFCSSGEGRR